MKAAYPYSTVVTGEADNYDLTTLAKVKEELGITNGDSNSLLSRMITEQSAIATTFCDRVFARETVVDSFRLSCAVDYLRLSRRPVHSLTSLIDDGSTLATEDYELVYKTGEVWRLDGSDVRESWGAVKVVITYIGGYHLFDTLPSDVERAVIEMVKQSWMGKSRDPGLRRIVVDGVGERYFTSAEDKDGIPPIATALLKPFCSITV